MNLLSDLNSQIDGAMGRDRHRLWRTLRSIQRAAGAGKPFDRSLDRLLEDLDRSRKIRESRRLSVPEIQVAADLPIAAKAEEIGRAIAAHPVTIVCGETGSGKSTQLPKICLGLGLGVDGMIGHTQPRRIAARSIATRLAEELATPLGRLVGYKVRFTDQTLDETLIKLMTDGVLLAETQHDRFLDRYGALIIDEAHERSLNIDFLLGYLVRLLPKRPELRVIITSATIDAARFAGHFRDPWSGEAAPVVEVSGRSYPVEIRYRPAGRDLGGSEGDLPADAIGAAVDELLQAGPGDLLVFLPTEREIRETASSLRARPSLGGQRTEILPLYARLSAADQNRIFQPHAHRRIVLATNVAESSLTVPGIRSVIDTGTARISRYSPRRKVQRLPIEPVSQASADQRAGRCGRLGPGICIRLYSEEDYLGRDRYTTPEIRRISLASVILQTKVLGLGEIEDFPFLDSPKSDAIRDGMTTLFELGAIGEDHQLTGLGRQLARLPVDPRIGRMVLAAAEEGCLAEVLIIAAALEVQDPRDRPPEKQEAADASHARFADRSSDFLSYLTLWDFYHDLRERLSKSQLRKACRENFLSVNRLREWLDVHRQLKQMAAEAGWKPATRAAAAAANPEQRYAAIHRALLSGLLSNIALRTEAGEYSGCGGQKLYLWPGSGIFQGRPEWIVAAELVETSRLFARTAARINPDWIEPLAGHLVQRAHRDPYWSRRHGSALVFERVTLFGLPIVQRRRVPLGPIDPIHSRELLIRHGLVEGELPSRLAFVEHNRQLLAELEQEATKLRRPDLFVGKAEQCDFYDARLPAKTIDFAQLKRWLKRSGRGEPRRLVMSRESIVGPPPEASRELAFPDEFALGATRLPLEYRFEPGSDEDGITLTVPRAVLGQLDAGRIGWLVPGLLEEKITALIRSLPKSLRRNFVPAPDVARKAVARLPFGEVSFLQAVAGALGEVCNDALSPESFQLDKLPAHLQMNIRVVDEDGQLLANGRDLESLQRGLGVERRSPFEVESPWHRDGVTRWDFGCLPEQVTVASGGIALVAYPMVIDRGAEAGLRLGHDPRWAQRQSRGGVRRLCCIAERHELRAQVAWLPDLDRLKLLVAPCCGARQFEEQLMDRLAELAFLDAEELPREEAEFAQLLERGRERVGLAVQEVARVIPPLAEAYHQAALALESVRGANWEYAVEDLRDQLAELTAGRFLADTPWRWLRHVPRYLRGIPRRLDKLRHGGLARDRQNFQILSRFLQDYRSAEDGQRSESRWDESLETFRWLLEEFRISLFAQDLGTSEPVSARRLQAHWERTRCRAQPG